MTEFYKTSDRNSLFLSLNFPVYKRREVIKMACEVISLTLYDFVI